jgi:integrase
MAFTDRAIKSHKPKERAYRKSDFPGGIRGLNIQITPAGVKSWMLRYQDHTIQKERFYTFGQYPNISLSSAREEAIKLKKRLKETGTLGAKNKTPLAVGSAEQLLEGYWTHLKENNAATWEQVKTRCKNHVIPYIGTIPAKDVTEDHIIDLLARIYKKGHRPMASRIRSYLLSTWRWGKQHDKDYRHQYSGIKFGLTSNPVADIPRDKGAEKVHDRVLSWGEIKMLWNADAMQISKPMQAALKLCLLLGGQRPSEVLGMHENELDLEEKVWRLPGSRTKNNRDHAVPLTDAAIEIITSTKPWRDNSGYIFPKRKEPDQPTRKDSLYHSTVKLCNKLNIKRWTPKDLRTTFKTLGGEIGLSKEIRDRIQNHAFSDVESKHYDMYSYLPEKREALEAWEKRLLSSIT